MKKALILSFLCVFFDALYDVFARIFAINWDISPLVFVSITYVVGAAGLLVIAGPGRLGIETIRQPHTWALGFVTMNLIFIMLVIMETVTATEANFLARVCVPLSTVFLWLFLGGKHKPTIHSILGSIGVCVGYGLVVSDLPAEAKAQIIFLSIIYGLMLVLRAVIAEFHPQSNESQTIKERCRVSGYVLLAIGLIYFFVTTGGALVNESTNGSHAVLNAIPYVE